MKVLSKYFKVALCFMAFALCSFMFAFTPTFTAVEAANMAITGYNVAINAIKMPTEEVDYRSTDPAKKEFKVPLLDTSFNGLSTANYKIRIVDHSGYNHDFDLATGKSVSENDKNFFTLDGSNLIVKAKHDGEYKVIYILTENGRTYYSNTYSVSVVNVTYELDFTTPTIVDGKIVGYSNNLIPTKMATSTTPYELPIAYAKIAGEDLTIEDGKVTNPSTVSTTGSKVKITVLKNNAEQVLDDQENPTVFTSKDGKYYLDIQKPGVYTVTYTYKDSTNRPSEPFEITVEEGYQAEELKLASTPTMPTMELGKEITLPKLTVNAGSETNVDVNVESIVIEKENSNGTIKHTLTDNNFKFVMSTTNFGASSYDAMVGNYRITYNIQGAHENQELTKTFKVSGVTVSSKPTIKLVYDNYNKDGVEAKGIETEIKAEYSADAPIILPGVYVEDAVTGSADEFYIVRAIRKGSRYYYIDNVKYDEEKGLTSEGIDEKYLNTTEDTTLFGDPTKAAVFTFSDEATNITGEYTLEYRVISKAVKQRENYVYVDGTTTKYKFNIVAAGTALKTSTSKITIENLSDSSVKNTDKISVKVSATDKDAEGNVVDTRLKNVVFTYSQPTANFDEETQTFQSVLQQIVKDLEVKVGVNKTCHVFEDARLIDGWDAYRGLNHYFEGIELVKESSTKNSFDLNLKEKTGSVDVVAVTMNDSGTVAVSETKKLTIKNTTTDDDAPVITVSNVADVWKNKQDTSKIAEFEVAQGKEVKLPVVYVNDEDKTLSLNVMYYIDSPENKNGAVKYLAPTDSNIYYGTETIQSVDTRVRYIDGGTITTSEAGIYYVAYTATDIAGNTSVMYFTFEVVDTSKPILSVNPVADDITLSGNTITGSKGTVIDFETALKSSDGETNYTDDATISISIKNGGKAWEASNESETSFKFNDYGTYVVTIAAEHTIKVNDEDYDLVADNKVFNVVIEKQELKWLGEFNVQSYAIKGETVELPDIAASNGAQVSVKYRLPDTTDAEAIEIKKDADTNGNTFWAFTTDNEAEGIYVVTYTATTDDDTLTKTFEIKVGDNVPPTISFNQGDLTQDLIYDGVNDIEYVVEVNRKSNAKSFVVKVINAGKEVYSYNIGLKIDDENDQGEFDYDIAWTNSNLSFELTGKNVKKGETSTTNNIERTQYLISGPGDYELKITAKDSTTYNNVSTKSIKFKVVTKAEVTENKDTVVGAVLIVISLILLAGVILFFTFTGKKGNGSKTRTKKEKVAKVNKAETKKVEEVQPVVEEKVEVETEQATEISEVKEEVQEVETKVDEEPKSGEVE